MKVTDAKFVIGAASLAQLPRGTLPEIAFLGPSNVGKSSLVNSLLGRQGLAKVSRTPGRTQQINIFRVNDVVHFVDLPGYGFAKAPRAVQDAFRLLVEQYLASSQKLKLLLLLQDSRRLPSERDLVLAEWLRDNRVPRAVILTKADKLSRSQLTQQEAAVRAAFGPLMEGVAFEPFSVTSGLGRREVWKVIDAAVA